MVIVESGVFEIELLESIHVQPRLRITGSLVAERGGQDHWRKGSQCLVDLRYRKDHLYGN